jgi:hypothetical protein
MDAMVLIGINLVIIRRDSMNSYDDYFEAGYAKCVHVKSTEYDDTKWTENGLLGKISVSPNSLRFGDTVYEGKKEGERFLCAELVNLKYIGVYQDNEPNAIDANNSHSSRESW